jgi:hypothetical protein
MNYPTGKGYFIWLLYRVAGGDPRQLAKMCKDAGLSWVALKVADGSYPFYANEYKKNVDLVPAAVQELHNAGIKVFGWHYVYGNPSGESLIAVNRVRSLSLDGYIIDAEQEYKNKPAQADDLMSRLRKFLPAGTSIGICSYRFPSYHPDFPWKSFSTCDYNMPQVYWQGAHNAGAQLQKSIYEFQQRGWKMPVIPVGSAYEEWGWVPSVDEIADFRTTAARQGMPGVGWWEMHDATVRFPQFWNATVGQMARDIPASQPALMKVVAKFSDVNMRSGPSITASRIGTLVMGKVYNIIEVSGRWGMIDGVGSIWCHLDYVTVIEGDAPAVTRFVKTNYATLRIRRSPDLDGEIVGFMVQDQAYGIVKEQGEWGRLSGSDERWVNLNYTVGI